jgi:HEAT repeat protein
MSTEICFDSYLNSVVSAYQQWWHLYTLSDATGRELHLVERDRISPAFFDFGLMVQTVEPPKAGQERELGQDDEKKEKIERLPVLEGICKYAADHVLLVGRPGSGKSTALARLLLQEAENALSIARAKIPVLVELRYLPSEANESSVFDRILAFMHKHDPVLDIDEAGIKQLLRQGRLLLLVDGVNELPSDRGRTQVNQFRELYQKTCPMIFTTRELSAGGDLGIAKRLEMQPLTEPQMQQFVMAYLPTQGEMLLRQLSGRLREFGQTPLLLWMLCSLFQQSEQIPPNLGMVFRAFTVGYGDRIKQDVTLSRDSRAWWGRLLQYLAFKMTCGENLTELQVAISRREAEQFLVEFLRGKVEFADDCAVRWLEDLLKHHLIQISNDRIEFRHQLIQEYYAAEWLLGLLPSLSDARLQQGYLNYLKWTEPLALMLELVEGEEQAVRVVRLGMEVDLRLGARLAGAVKYGFQEKTVGLLMREIEERKIPKLYAIKLFGETRSDYAIKFLIKALKHQDNFYLICSIASEALVQIGSDRSVESLILILNDKNQDFFVRSKVVEVLGNIRSKKSIEALIQSLRDNDSSVRNESAKALGEIGSERAVKPLIQSTRNQEFYIGEEAVRALGNIKDDEAIEALIQILNEKNIITNPDLREDAAEELGKIASRRAVESLIKALEDQSSRLRWRAVKALGLISSDEAIEILIQKLKSQHSSYILKSYIIALGEIRNDRAIEPLLQILNDKKRDPEVRAEVAEALGEIGKDTVVEPLIKVLNDQNPEVRAKVAEALGKIGKDTVVEPLIKALNDQNPEVRAKVAEALGKIGKDTVVEPLIKALNDLVSAKFSVRHFDKTPKSLALKVFQRL